MKVDPVTPKEHPSSKIHQMMILSDDPDPDSEFDGEVGVENDDQDENTIKFMAAGFTEDESSSY